MRMKYGFLTLLLLGVALVAGLAMPSEGEIIIPPCGPDEPDFFCARYCNTAARACWGPGLATQACIELPQGCLDGGNNNPCCRFGGGF